MAKAAVRAEKPKDEFNLEYRLGEVLDHMLREWKANPGLFSNQDTLRILQYGSMFCTRRAAWSAQEDESNAGSAVRRYSGAFQTTHVASGGKTGARSAKPTLVAALSDDDTGDDAA